MNNELSAESDFRNMITIDITETMTPEIELTETELEAMDDIRIQDELTAMVAELPVFTDEQNTRYSDKMTMLADIRNEIPSLKVVVVTEETESYTVPGGRYDYVYSMGTIWNNLEKDLIPVLQATGFIAAQFAMINEIETTTTN